MTGKLMNVDDVTALKTVSGYAYSGKDVGKLGATEYTLVVVQVDRSLSVEPFKSDLEKALQTCVDSCKKSSEAEKILVRVCLFNEDLKELHGFIPLFELDVSKYLGTIEPEGNTALFDATHDSIETVADYGKHLSGSNFLCNAIVFVVTDGVENSSRIATTAKIKNRIAKIKSDETLESLRTVLVGVGDKSVEPYLESFKDEVGLDQFVWIGDATPNKLAKLANFISQSVSSQSKALGSGAASQPLTF